MTTALANITPTELRRRTELESELRSCIDGFAKAGEILTEIRDSRLYRNTHATFEDYCQSEWGMSRPRAYQLIDAAAVVSTLVDNPPTSERQARALTHLPPEEQREAWTEAVKTAPNGKPTAKHVEEVVARRKPKDEQEPEPTKTGPRMWGDRVIPDDAPPLDLDVSGEPTVIVSKFIRDMQGCIVRKPQKEDVEKLSAPQRKYLRERTQGFIEALKELA